MLDFGPSSPCKSSLSVRLFTNHVFVKFHVISLDVLCLVCVKNLLNLMIVHKNYGDNSSFRPPLFLLNVSGTGADTNHNWTLEPNPDLFLSRKHSSSILSLTTSHGITALRTRDQNITVFSLSDLGLALNGLNHF